MSKTCKAFFKATKILKNVCPIDLYSSRMKRVPSATREHVVPKKLLSKSASADFNNIHVCTSAMNSHRGVLPFGKIDRQEPGVTILDGYYGTEVDPIVDAVVDEADTSLKTLGRFMPPAHARGAVARACLYMCERYPTFRDDILNEVMDIETMLEWDREYPVMGWEISRSLRILALGYPLNTFVCKDISRLPRNGEVEVCEKYMLR
jgi:endonuclease I